jgi:hypothetical protein
MPFFLELFEKVLLIVVEIRRHVSRIVLFGRSLVGTEVISVPPGALREVDGLERGNAASTVFTRLTNMFGPSFVRQSAGSSRSTAMYMSSPGIRDFATRHGNDISATLLKQVSQHVTAGRAGGTYDKCGTLRHRPLSSLLYVALISSTRSG